MANSCYKISTILFRSHKLWFVKNKTEQWLGRMIRIQLTFSAISAIIFCDCKDEQYDLGLILF